MRYALNLIFLLAVFNTWAQELINDPLPVVEKEPIWQLTNATGIYKGKDGQWDSAKNKLSFELDTKHKALNDFEKYLPGRDNFIRIQLTKILLKGNKLNLLTKLSNTGYYKYPSIEKDWINNKMLTYYIFSDKEKLKLKNANGIIKINCIQSGVFKFCDEDCEKNLPAEINKKRSSVNGLTLYLNINSNKEQDQVKFLFFSSDENEFTKKSNLTVVSGGLNEPYRFKKEVLLSKELFNNYFYQTSHTAFQKLLD